MHQGLGIKSPCNHRGFHSVFAADHSSNSTTWQENCARHILECPLIIMIFLVKINASSCPRPAGKAISPFCPEIGLVIIMVSLNFIQFLCLQRGHLWPTYWKGWPTPELVPLDLFWWWIPRVSGITLITPYWINPNRRKQDVIPVHMAW